MKEKRKTYLLTECAIMIALATVLSICKLYNAPLGGSVTLLSMFPILFVSIRHNVKWGIATGFIYGVLQMLLSLSTIAYIPTTLGFIAGAILDYVLPYTLLGCAGIFMHLKPQTKWKELSCIIGGIVLALVLRFSCHLLSGVTIWYELTKEQEWNEYVKTVGMWTYSFVYNIAWFGPDAALVLVASPVMLKLRNIAIGERKS